MTTTTEEDLKPDAPPAPGPWMLVHEGVRAWFGQLEGTDGTNILVLSPAYEYLASWVQDAGRGLHRTRILVPIETMVSTTRVRVHPSAISIVFDELDELDQKFWMQLVAQAEAIREAQRVARSGIKLATKMPAPPPRHGIG